MAVALENLSIEELRKARNEIQSVLCEKETALKEKIRIEKMQDMRNRLKGCGKRIIICRYDNYKLSIQKFGLRQWIDNKKFKYFGGVMTCRTFRLINGMDAVESVVENLKIETSLDINKNNSLLLYDISFKYNPNMTNGGFNYLLYIWLNNKYIKNGK